ncbi:MAG: cell division protein FtsZ [Vicingaceae bacterium]
MKFDLPKDRSSIIKVIGVGGGGSNAVTHMFNQGITGVDFIICNTDQQALEMSGVTNKVQLGPTLTEGRGAGSIPEVGKNSAIETIDEMKDILAKGTQMVFITAGMGGGTGTGAAPIIAQAAREMGILTVGIVTIPFSFEGKRRKQQADLGLEELRQNVDTLLVICNDRLREMYGNLKISDAFAKADDILTVAAKGIAEIITVAGYINVDFEDVRTVMQQGGTAIMGSASASGDDRATKAVSHALASPLLNDNDIKGAKYILLNITSGDDEISMDEIDEITDYIQNETGYTADLIWGNGKDEQLGDSISVTIIATGFGPNAIPDTSTGESSTKRIVRNLNEDEETSSTAPTNPDDNADANVTEAENEENEPFLKKSEESDKENQITFLFEGNVQEEKEPAVNDDENKSDKFDIVEEMEDSTDDHQTDNPRSNIDNLPNDEQIKKSQERIMRLKALSLKMKTSSGISEMESEPAYKRRSIKLDDVPHSSEDNISRFTLSEEDDNKTKLRENNSFLHDNVD